MIAGTLEVQLLANMARLQADMDTAKRTVGGAMSSIESTVAKAKAALIGLGAIGLAGAFAAQMRGAIDLADSINKLTQRTGMSAESLSQWQYAAKLADVSNESFATGVKKLNINIAQGLAGDKEKIATFRALGITLTDASGKAKNADQVLMEMADAFASAKDGAGKTALAVALLGKAGDEMIPLLNGGSGAIKAMKTEADQLGLTISGDFAKQAEEFNDNITRLTTSSKKLFIVLAQDLVASLGDITKGMADASVEWGKSYAIFQAIDKIGNNLFDTEGTGQRKKMAWLQQDIAEARQRLNFNINAPSAVKQALQADLDLLTGKLEVERAAYFKLNSAARGGRGTSDDPRVLGSVGSIEQQVRGMREIKAPGSSTAATESVYDKLIERIKAKTEAERIETQIGRELTEHEKFAIGIMAEADKAKSKLTSTQKSAVEAALAEVKVLTDANALRKSEYDAAMVIAKARQDARNAEYKAGQDLVTQATEDNTARNKTAREMLDNIRFETTLLKMTAVEREQAIAMRDLERSGIREGTQAWNEYAVAIREATGNKAALQEQADDARRLGDSIEDGIMNGFRKGKSLADIFLDELKAQFAKTILRPMISPIAEAGNGILKQLLGGMSGAGGMQAAFSGTSLGSSGFGTGLAYGNMDLGGFFADGGRPPMGKASVVGERGPELFVPDSAGTIIPNGAMGGGGTTIAPVYNIRVDARSDQAAVAAGVARALRDNNKSLVEELRR